MELDNSCQKIIFAVGWVAYRLGKDYKIATERIH